MCKWIKSSLALDQCANLRPQAGPFRPFACTRQYSVPTGREIVGLYKDELNVTFIIEQENVLLFETRRMYPLAPSTSDQLKVVCGWWSIIHLPDPAALAVG